MSVEPTRLSVLFYDGQCGLCNRVVRLLLQTDRAGRLRFATLQSAPAQAYLRQQGLPTQDFDSLVFVPDWERPTPAPISCGPMGRWRRPRWSVESGDWSLGRGSCRLGCAIPSTGWWPVPAMRCSASIGGSRWRNRSGAGGFWLIPRDPPSPRLRRMLAHPRKQKAGPRSGLKMTAVKQAYSRP